MKKSVKQINYQPGQRVYYTEGVKPRYFRGTIVENMIIAVKLRKPNGNFETVEKSILGIVLPL